MKKVFSVLTQFAEWRARCFGAMPRRALWLAAFLGGVGAAYGQCGSTTLTSQAAVNSFSCTEVTGNLTISGPSVDDLTPLLGLRRVTGGLTVSSTSVTSLAGLDSLRAVGEDFRIIGNDVLIGMSALAQLDSIGSSLLIQNNALPNLNGLQGIDSVGANLLVINNNDLFDLTGLNNLQRVGGRCFIDENSALVSVNGLNSLTSVGTQGNDHFYVRFNPSLADLTALSNLTSVAGELVIRDDDALTTLNGLGALTSVGGAVGINGNAVLTDITALSRLASVGTFVALNANISLASLDGLDNIGPLTSLFLDNNPSLTDISALAGVTSLSLNFRVANNDALTNLNGLQNLQRIDGFCRILNNGALTSLGALSSLDSVGGELRVEDNPQLSDCCVLEEVFSDVGGNIDIDNNATGCDSQSDIVATCAAPGPIVWTGITSAGFNDPQNWAGGEIPAADAAVLLPAGTPNSPILTNSIDLGSLTIQSGATFTNNGTLRLGDSLRADGAYEGEGETQFAGSDLRVTGNGTVAFTDLTIGNTGFGPPSPVTLGAPASVSGTLQFNNGALILAEDLTLVSDDIGTARLDEMPSGATITSTGGQMVVQRSLGASQARYYNLGAPTESAGRQFDFPFNISGGELNSLFVYDETEDAPDRNQGWTAPADVQAGLPAGQGFVVFLNAPQRVSTRGIPNVGSVVAPVSFTGSGTPTEDGWNLLANPYPSNIDWTQAQAAATNLTPFAYVRRNSNNYQVIEAGVGTPVVRSSESFWVKATAAPALTFTEGMKTAAAGRPAAPDPVAPQASAALALRQQNKTLDEATVRFRPAATGNYEAMRDALKMFGGGAAVATLATSGEWLAINTLGELSGETTVPLAFTGAEGAYTFEAQPNLPADATAYLFDYATDTAVVLTAGITYPFAHEGGTTSDRFALGFSATVTSQPTVPTREAYLHPMPARDRLHVTLSGAWSPSAAMAVYDALGRVVCRTPLAVGRQTLTPNLPAGVYQVRLSDAYGALTRRLVVE